MGDRIVAKIKMKVTKAELEQWIAEKRASGEWLVDAATYEAATPDTPPLSQTDEVIP